MKSTDMMWCVEQRWVPPNVEGGWDDRHQWSGAARFYPGPRDDVGYPAFDLSRDEAVNLASLLTRCGGLWRFRVRAY